MPGKVMISSDWINFGISFVVIFVSLLLITQLLLTFLLRISRQTKSDYDEAYLLSIKGHVRILVLVISLDFASNRLLFLPVKAKNVLDQFFFAAIVLILAVIVWKLVDHLVLWYQDLASKAGKHEPKEAALQFIQRAGHIIVVMVSALLILDHFVVNVTALLATLGIGGLAVSLAAQDTLSNMVSGVMLVIDQPFRIGDRIEIQGLNAWGDVVDIGLRSTRLRMGDNRMVIVPNSSISRNYVINYSYPDPSYREQIDLEVNHGSNPHYLRELITQAVRSVEGVLVDKPVDVLFMDFDASTVSLRVRWWNATHSDSRQEIDKVNEAIFLALKDTNNNDP